MPATIQNKEDIIRLVDAFYQRVQKDELLGPVFNKAIGNKWPKHLNIMYRFWETLLLEKHTYSGHPFVKHAPLPIKKEHFDRWLSIFNQTVDELFEGALAGEAKNRAFKMAHIFQIKLDYMHQSNGKTIF